MSAVGRVIDIPWQDIRPMQDQPRSYFDQTALRELADSIAAIGQVVPAQVTPLTSADGVGHRFELVDGQRRWHAIQIAGLRNLRAEVVRETDPDQRFVMSVVANLSREANHPMEIAGAVARMRKTMNVEQVAATLGKSSKYVFNHMRLLDLRPDLQELLHPSTPKQIRLPLAAAFRLASLPRHEQIEAMQRAKAIDASPGRAIKAVLDQVVPVGEAQSPAGTGRKRSSWDHWFALEILVRRAGHDLERYDDGLLGRLLSIKKAEDVEKMRWALDRLHVRLGRILDTFERRAAK